MAGVGTVHTVTHPHVPLVREGVGDATFPIVIFTNSMLMGGMEAHVLQLASALRARGRAVAVICTTDEVIAPLRQALAHAGVEVHALSSRQASLTDAIPRVRELAAVLRRYPGAVLHMHLTGHRGGELVMLAARLAGVRAIVRSMHLPPTGAIGARERLLVRMTDLPLSRIVCVSRETRRAHLDALRRDPRKCVVVHNGVDIERFSPDIAPLDVRAEFGFDETAPIVGTVARLGETRKGIHDFIDAAAIVVAKAPNARFLIIGDGELRSGLEQRAADLGIAERVRFAGHRTDIPEVLTALQVFVSPSIYEACQYNLLEAMAAARPVVTTMTGVAPEVIVDGVTGRAARASDARSLASAILDLLAAPEAARAMGARARMCIADGFSVDMMVDRMLALYRGAAARA